MKTRNIVLILWVTCFLTGCYQETLINESGFQETNSLNSIHVSYGEFGNFVNIPTHNGQSINSYLYYLSKSEVENIVWMGNNLLQNYPALGACLSLCEKAKMSFGRDTDESVYPTDPRWNKAAYYNPDDRTIFFREGVTPTILLHEVLHFCQHQSMGDYAFKDKRYARYLEYEVAVIMDVLSYYSKGTFDFHAGTPNGNFNVYRQLIQDMIEKGGVDDNALQERLIDCMGRWATDEDLEATGIYNWGFLNIVLKMLKQY